MVIFMKLFAICSILAAGTLWGTIGIFIRALTQMGFGAMELVALRSFGAFLALAVYLAVFKRSAFRIRLKDWWCFAGTGILSLLFFNYCYFTAINLTSLSTACILLYTAPIIVMLLSLLLFKERLTVSKCVSALLAFLGCALAAGFHPAADLSITPEGLLAGLGAGLGYALYSIFGRYALNRGYSSLTITLYTFAFSSLGSLFLTDTPALAGRVFGSPESLPWILALALVTCAAAYLLYTYGLTKIESSRASILASIEPAVATLVGFLAFQEPLTLWSAAGICLVFLSLILLNADGLFKKRFAKRPGTDQPQ